MISRWHQRLLNPSTKVLAYIYLLAPYAGRSAESSSLATPHVNVTCSLQRIILNLYAPGARSPAASNLSICDAEMQVLVSNFDWTRTRGSSRAQVMGRFAGINGGRLAEIVAGRGR